MKRLSKIIVLAAALHIALPAQAADVKVVPTASRSWTSTQMLVAGAVGAAAACGLYYLYNRWFKPAPVRALVLSTQSSASTPSNGMMQSSGTMTPFDASTSSDLFALMNNATVDQIRKAEPQNVRQIAGGKFRGVDCVLSKGHYPSGQDAYVVKMQSGSGSVELGSTDIASLSQKVKGALETMFKVGEVNVADIEAFLRAKYN